MILVIDNYDSFTYNLVQLIREIVGELPSAKDRSVWVHRNDAIGLNDVMAMKPSRIVISPGPGKPEDASLANEVIRALASTTPILGVCLGHQCLAWCFGARVVSSPNPTHGKTSIIHHDGRGVFRDLPTPVRATRYHSLIVDSSSVPDRMEISARTDRGEIMGLRIRNTLAEGVQFHPESILSEQGKRLIGNFLIA